MEIGEAKEDTTQQPGMKKGYVVGPMGTHSARPIGPIAGPTIWLVDGPSPARVPNGLEFLLCLWLQTYHEVEQSILIIYTRYLQHLSLISLDVVMDGPVYFNSNNFCLVKYFVSLNKNKSRISYLNSA